MNIENLWGNNELLWNIRNVTSEIMFSNKYQQFISYM